MDRERLLARRAQARRARRRRRQALAVATALVVAAGATFVVARGPRPRSSAAAAEGRSPSPVRAADSRPATARSSISGSPLRARPTGTPVPILVYHVIAAPPAGAPLPELYVSPTDFSDQMAWLADNGYHAVTLYAVYLHWRTGASLPAKPIVLTFDDGYRSDDVNARPVLAAHHWPGVLNLEVANERPSWGLDLVRLRRLVDAGWEIDAHTITHPDLTTLDAFRLQQEVAGSRTFIRRQLHQPVDFFCYPAGRYDVNVMAAVRAAGFLGATTETFGLATPPDFFALNRVKVNGSDGVPGLAAKLVALSSRS
jgi:peptidoglycan/xylan/chitin deacetylase (PgdA/CDA1 family)